MHFKYCIKPKVIFANTLLSTMCLTALTVSDAHATDIGLAVSIGGDDSAIAIPIRTQGYLIQPEVSYGFFEETDEERVNESEMWSLGVFGYKRVGVDEKLEALFGLGLGYTAQDYDDRYGSYSYEGSYDGYFIAPAIGLSYNLSDNISFAIEARYRYESFDQETHRIDSDPDWPEDEIQKREAKRAYTNTRVTLRYYFAGI